MYAACGDAVLWTPTNVSDDVGMYYDMYGNQNGSGLKCIYLYIINL